MSDLWLILVLLGIGIVVSVMVYNWWQERKYQKVVEQHFDISREDVLNQATTGQGESNSTRAKPNEDTEGWMSEPRVRGASKIEPTFFNPSTESAETKASQPPAQSTRMPTEPTELDRSAMLAEPTPSAFSNTASASTMDATAAPTLTPAPSLSFDVDDTTEPATTEALSQAHSVTHAQTTLASDGLAFQQPMTALSASTPLEDPTPIPQYHLPSFLHLAMDWVGVISLAQSAPFTQIAEIQTQLSDFSQYTACWIQSEQSSTWQNILSVNPDQSPAVTRIACAIQLADRGGPVDAATIERFRQLLLALGMQLGGEVDWLSDTPLKLAHQIDAFSIEVDKAVEFHLMATQGMFHATKLRGLAEANGLQLSEQGRFEQINADGLVAFTIRNLEGKPFSADMLKSAVMTGMTFQLDIPTTPDNLDVFEQMVQLARQFATSLNAEMQDVNRKPIAAPQLEKIRQQLISISATMQAQGIAPGSQHARRLFS